MINKDKILGLLGLSARAGKVIFGTDACIEYVNKNKVKLLLIAEDASDRTKLKFNEIAKDTQIPIYELGSIDEISKSIGKKNKAIIGITDINFSKEIIKRINRGWCYLSKIKIHEIAKKLGASSKEVIAIANEVGINITSHLSSVEEEQEKRL